MGCRQCEGTFHAAAGQGATRLITQRSVLFMSSDVDQKGGHAPWPAGQRPRVLVTQAVPQPGIDLLRTFADVETNPEEGVIWSKEELLARLPGHDALYCLLTDTIDAEVMNAAPDLRVIANMAVGFNNIDITEATRRGIPVT